MEKPPKSHWLFLRGLGRESEHWGDFPHSFARLTNSSVITLDFPGMGQRHQEKSPSSLLEIVDSLRHEWLKVKHNGGLQFLLGLSLGGMVGIEWVRRYSQDFAGAVFINTSVPRLSSPWSRLRPEALLLLLKTPLAKNLFEREKMILSQTSNYFSQSDKLAHLWSEIAEKRPAKLQNILRQLQAAVFWSPPQQCPLPSLLLLGSERDRLCDPKCTKALAEQWHCDVALHPTAGHELPLDDPDWVSGEIKKWLTKFVFP